MAFNASSLTVRSFTAGKRRVSSFQFLSLANTFLNMDNDLFNFLLLVRVMAV